MTRSREGAGPVVCALAMCVAFAAGACGGDGHGPSPGGDDDDSLDGGLTGNDGSPADAPVNAEGPVIEILAPTAPAAGDYTSAAILVVDRVRVVCQVER